MFLIDMPVAADNQPPGGLGAVLGGLVVVFGMSWGGVLGPLERSWGLWGRPWVGLGASWRGPREV